MDPLGVLASVPDHIKRVQAKVSPVHERQEETEELPALLGRLLRILGNVENFGATLDLTRNRYSASSFDDAPPATAQNVLSLARARKMGSSGGANDQSAKRLSRTSKRAYRVKDRRGGSSTRLKLGDAQQDILDFMGAWRNQVSDSNSELNRFKSQFQALIRDQAEKQVVSILDWICHTSLCLDGPVWATSPIGDEAGLRFTKTDHVYREWVNSRTWQFNCFGNPGCGKSVRALAVYKDLQRRWKDDPNAAVMSAFFDRNQKASQSLVAVMCSLLRQAITSRREVEITSEIREQWQQAKTKGLLERGLDLDQARDYLYDALSKFQIKYLVVDALNEAEGCDVSKLEKEIKDLRKNCSVCIFSTDSTDTRDRFDQVLCCKCKTFAFGLYFRCKSCRDFLGQSYDICLDCHKSKRERCADTKHTLKPPDRVNLEMRPDDMSHEMERYVQDFLAQELQGGDKGSDDEMMYSGSVSILAELKDKLGPELWNSIPAKVNEAAQGNFRHAQHFLERLNRQSDVEGAQSLLLRLEIGSLFDADEYYEKLYACLNQAEEINRETARSFMVVLSRACEILSFDAVAHAVAIQPGNQKRKDFTFRLKGKDRVRKDTRGLLRIQSSDRRDYWPVGWFHPSLSTYVGQNHSIWFPDADQVVFDACFSYLGLADFSKPFQSLEELTKTLEIYPFASYASRYWGTHAHDAVTNAPDSIARTKNVLRTLETFADQDRMDCIMQVAWHCQSSADIHRWDVQGGISALHACSFHDLPSVCEALLEFQSPPDVVEDSYNQTPLIYACRKGNIDIVLVLLEAGANINHVTALGSTPLLEAIANGQEEVFTRLLDRADLDVNLTTSSSASTNALIKTIEMDKLGMMQQLLEHPAIDVNRANLDGRTALITATQEVRVDAVALLLRDANLDLTLQNRYSNSALDMTAHPAAYVDISDPVCEIARLLLQDPRCPNVSEAAVIMTITDNRVQLLKLFIAAGFDPAYSDSNGRSFLHLAAKAGVLDVVRLIYEYLASHPSFNIDQLDSHKATALHAACSEADDRHIETIKYLLDAGADAMLTNSDGALASRLARIALPERWMTDLRPLFERHMEAASLDELYHDMNQLGPLIRLNRLEALKTMLGSSQGLLNSETDPYTLRTILHQAVEAPDDSCLELLAILLPRCRSFINAQDDCQRTCLHYVVTLDLHESLKKLVDVDGIDLDLLDRWNASAFDLAQGSKRFELCVSISAAGAKLPPANKLRPEVLHAAVKAGDFKAIKNLVEAGINVFHYDAQNCKTPQQLAISLQEEAIERAKEIAFRNLSEQTATEITAYEHALQRDPEFVHRKRIVEYLQQAEMEADKRATKRRATKAPREILNLIAKIKAQKPEMARGKQAWESGKIVPLD